MATTRLQLFRDVALELGDRIELTATSGGATTTFIATDDMLFPDGSLDGREAWYATAQSGSTANAQTRRLVTDTDETAATVTVNPAWPSAPSIGDVLILVNSRGTGVTIPEIHQKLNQIVRRVAIQMGAEVAGTAATFDATSPILAVPTTWEDVLGMQVEWDGTGYPDVFESIPGDPLDYQVWDRTATVRPTYRTMCHSKRVRLIGTTALAELNDDADTTTLPAAWVSKLAAAELLERAAVRSGDAATALTLGELIKTEWAGLSTFIGSRRTAVGRRKHFGATA